jgi:hypothetical protein
MFNCFTVYLGNSPIGIFRTETAAENFIETMGWGEAALGDGCAVARGEHIPGLPF